MTLPTAVQGREGAHTDLPWILESYDADAYGIPIIGDNLGGLVAFASCWSTEIKSAGSPRVAANAAFIVRACNAHYELLEAIKQLRKGYIELYTGEGGLRSSAEGQVEIVDADAAIRAAEGQ